MTDLPARQDKLCAQPSAAVAGPETLSHQHCQAVPASSDVPELSVVMCVYNGGSAVEGALASVLQQEGVEFELIVVNDGSDAETTELLRSWARRDVRVRLVEQPNQGLTSALIRGCSLARAAIIARQDGDDESMPGRLRALRDAFATDPILMLTSSSVAVVGPRGELLYIVTRSADPDTNRHALLHNRRGPPSHGACAFRRDAYVAVGGYREPFRYAQDSDLWLRLAERGRVSCIPSVLYRYSVHPEAISGARAFHQGLFGELGQACLLARRAGQSEVPLLAQAGSLLARKPPGAHRPQADAYYFIGSCLLRRADPRSARYLWLAWKAAPWRPRTTLKALAATVLRLVRWSPPKDPTSLSAFPTPRGET